MLVRDAFTAFRYMGMAIAQAARHCLQMDWVWRKATTQKQRDSEATCYARKFIPIDRLIGLGGFGQIVAVGKVLWSLILLVIKHKLCRA